MAKLGLQLCYSDHGTNDRSVIWNVGRKSRIAHDPKRCGSRFCLLTSTFLVIFALLINVRGKTGKKKTTLSAKLGENKDVKEGRTEMKKGKETISPNFPGSLQTEERK